MLFLRAIVDPRWSESACATVQTGGFAVTVWHKCTNAAVRRAAGVTYSGFACVTMR